jgi:hypothetical protein
MSSPEPTGSQYEAAIGPRAARYLPIFRRFAAGGRLSWNWAAFFGTFAWLRYRGMAGWSWAYLPVSTPVLATVWMLGVLNVDACQRALGAPRPLVAAVALVLIALGFIVPPLVADRLYFARLRAMLAHAKIGPPGRGHARGAGGVAGALVMQALISMAALFAVGSYGDYTYRAKMSEAVLTLGEFRTVITEEFERGKMPLKDPAALAAAFKATSMVKSVSIAPDGTIKATLGYGLLDGRSLMLMPRVRDGVLEEWICRSDDLPEDCVPRSCRRPGP